MAKTIFSMADGILTPCNVALSWYWFRQVTALRNVAGSSGIMTVNSESWQHPAMWYVALGWHAVEFARWQHPAMWHIALGSWHGIRQVAAPCNVAGGSGMPWNSPKRPPYWNSTSGFDFDHITAVDMSFCTSLRNVVQIGPPSAEKMTSYWFSRWRVSAILDFRGPIMRSLKSPCMTSYRSSVDSSKLLSFWENRVFAIWRQSDRRTDRHARRMKPLSLSRAAA